MWYGGCSDVRADSLPYYLSPYCEKDVYNPEFVNTNLGDKGGAKSDEKSPDVSEGSVDVDVDAKAAVKAEGSSDRSEGSGSVDANQDVKAAVKAEGH